LVHKYTNEQKKFIESNIKGTRSNKLTKMFNEEFKTDLRVSQIRAYIKNHNLKSGLNTRFEKGHKPWNKDKKGLVTGGKETQFKKGNVPFNYMPVGSERVNGDGYVDIKIADPNKWKGKHILVWEKHNGPVPAGHAVIFGDRNNRNFDIDNLIMVSRKQLLQLNRNNLIKNDANLTRTGVLIADLYQKISEKRK
jgi:hypothetical protein